MKKTSVIAFLFICFALAIAIAFFDGKNDYAQAISIAEKYGDVLGIRRCRDNKGEFFIVDSSAFNGAELLISDGEICGVDLGENGVAIMSEQVDFKGNTVTVPIDRQEKDEGEIYYLSDFTKNIFTYRYMSNFMGEEILPYESENGIFDDGMAVSIYDTVLRAYYFYENESNIGVSWKGINGKNDDYINNAKSNGEIELLVYVHYGNMYENANCGFDKESGYAIMYVGDGKKDGTLYQQGKARDVIGHEYQHAITDFAAMGGNGIINLNEAGAISEAVSDIFGALIEGHDPGDERFWSVGEDAVARGQWLRSISSPQEGYVIHVSDELPLCNKIHNHYDSGCDYGSTHGNSVILTHAQYRMWQQMPEFFTRENIGKLWFATLCRLSYRADFEDFASAMLEACEELDFPDEAKATVKICLFERGLIKGKRAHILSFRNEEGKEIEKISVEHGGNVIAPVLPDKETNVGTYKFVGWDGKTSNIVENEVLFPKYELVSKTHRVTFMVDGEEFAQVEVEHGKGAECPVTPFKQSDKIYNYVFARWDKDISCVVGNMEVNAVFDAVYIDYYVTFFNGKKVFDTQKAHYNDVIKNFASPSRFGFDFVGWKSGSEIIKSLTVLRNESLDSVWRLSAWVYGVIVLGAIALCVAIVAIILHIRRRN